MSLSPLISKSFTPFYGVVEDRRDPLKMGRVRIRIIGIHSDNHSLVPTESLPWAQVSVSPSSAITFSGPKEGDWVHGYFMDGEAAQEPLITGVFNNGILRDEVPRPNNSPILVSYDRDNTISEPTTPRIVRGVIDGTQIGVTNNNQSHICDISLELSKDVALARLKFGQVIQSIRDAIRALIAALGLDPSGEFSKVITLFKKLTAELKKIQAWLEEIADYSKVIIEYARKVKALIDYILSLPAKLYELLKDCLSNFLSAVATGLAELFTLPGTEGVQGSSDVSALLTSLSDLGQAGVGVVESGAKVLAIPAEVAGTLLTPSSATAQQEAANTLIDYLATHSSNTTSATDMGFALGQYSTP